MQRNLGGQDHIGRCNCTTGCLLDLTSKRQRRLALAVRDLPDRVLGTPKRCGKVRNFYPGSFQVIEQRHARNVPKQGILCKGHIAQAVLYHPSRDGRSESHMPTGTNLKQLRADRGLSQTALAEKIGTTLNFYGKLERGQRRLNMTWLKRLAEALGVGMNQIVAEVEPEEEAVNIPVPTQDALQAMIAEHHKAVMGEVASRELIEDLTRRILCSVENWKDDPDAARDPMVARSVARQINLRFAH